MNNLELFENINLENMIYKIRNTEVMLAEDVATLYQVDTKKINSLIKRHLNHFPKTFIFSLTDNESEEIHLKRQSSLYNELPNKDKKSISQYALTSEGIMMLSAFLKSDIAVTVNVKIINAFVKMHKYLSSNILEQQHYKNMLLEDHNRLISLEESFSRLYKHPQTNAIFFEGQTYDAHSLLMKILKEAQEEIIIIDNFCTEDLFDILKDIDKKIILVTRYINNNLYNKYNGQYSNVTYKINKSFHDRFIIIDRKILYHSGASFKDIGTKCFAINLIEDQTIIENLIREIDKE